MVRVTAYPKPGSMLGRFRIKRKLGASDTGVVYRAEDTLLGVAVALKIFSPALADDESFKAISREVLITRRLSHPSICKLHDLHQEEGFRFLTMDLVEGTSLRQILDRDRKGRGLALRDAVQIVAAAGEAIAVAHQEKVVHRNLKPANILVAESGLVTVLDFGHARAPDMGGKTQARVQQDDIAFTAQEVLFGQPATALSDVYSLGAILYRCVTGRTPLETSGPVQETSGFRGAQPVRPSQINRQISRALEQVILTAIAANPESRYKTAGEFTAELLETTEDLSVRTRRPKRPAELMAEPREASDLEVTDETKSLAGSMERSTLLFSDIVGITAFFEQNGDIAGRKRIERHNQLLFPVIRKLGGTVLKTIGDAIMASFPDEDEAVAAAIRMQQALEAFNDRVAHDVDRISIRIGINTGETILEYGDAYGDAVNVAARVCAKAEGEQILISEDTWRELTRNRDIVNPHSRVALKGKRGMFQLYQVDWMLAEDAEPGGEEPPDLSIGDDEITGGGLEPTASTVEPTAIVDVQTEQGMLDKAVDVVDQLASRARKIGEAPDSWIDRFYAQLGMQRNAKTTFALVLVVVTLLVLVAGLIWAMCAGDPRLQVRADPDRPASDSPAAPTGLR
jgi:serine/threonine-protein kinase